MKHIFRGLFLFVPLLLFISCNEYYQHYYYLNKNDMYLLKKGDTLVYKSTQANDTFVVDDVGTAMSNSDKVYNYESQGVSAKQLVNGQLKKTGYILTHSGDNEINVVFRNVGGFLYLMLPVPYKIGDHALNNVYIGAALKDDDPEDLVKLYYTNHYGIIAYETISGETYVLDEKYLK